MRGIANLKAKKKLTKAQALSVFQAARYGSPLFRSVFGKIEKKLIAMFVKKANEIAFKKTRTPGDMMKHFGKTLPIGIAYQLAQAQASGKAIYYRAGGATQQWTVESFRRFIANPVYKARREAVLGGGKFWIANYGGLKKKGKTRLVVT